MIAHPRRRVIGFARRTLAGYDVERRRPAAGRDDRGTFFQDVALILVRLAASRGSTAGAPRRRSSGCAGSSSGAAVGLARRLRGSCSSPSRGIWAARARHQARTTTSPQELGADDSSPALSSSRVLICVVAPIAEELFFRGFMFTALRAQARRCVWRRAARRARLRPRPRARSRRSADRPLGVFGVGLCLLYWRTGSIIPVHGPARPQQLDHLRRPQN